MKQARMNKFNLLFVIGVVAALTSAGCNAGTAPAGASPEQVKAEVDKEPPLQQIRNLMFAPIPPAEKERQIKELEAKFNVKREDAMKDLPKPKFDTSKPPPEVPSGK